MAKTNAQEILNKLQAKKATNINNSTTINNINDINDSTTSMIVPDDHNQVEDISLRSPLGLASLSAPQNSPETLAMPRDLHFSGGNELPPTWRGAKWDIYKDRSPTGLDKIKVKLSVIKQDKTSQGLIASMNSPHDRLWRGVVDDTTVHWQTVREHYTDYRKLLGPTKENWRVSKFYLNRKQSSIDIMTLFLHWTQKAYCLRLIFDGVIYDYEIDKNSYEQLTERQLKTNQIATAFFGKSQVKMIHPKDLGLL